MAEPAGYVRQITSLNESLGRYTLLVKDLKKQKLLAQSRLYEHMKKHDLEEYQGIKIAKIAPKPKVVRVKDRDKKAKAVELFSQLGLNDPEGVYETLRTLQKPKVAGEEDGRPF